MEEAKKKRKSKGKFHRAYNRAGEGLSEDEEEEVLKKIHEDLEDAYKVVEEKTELLIEALDTGDGTGDEESNRLEEDIKGMYNELCEIRKRLAKLKMEEKKRAKAEEKELKEVRVYGETKAETIKIKRLQAPNFNGNIRDYPSFKRDYENHMEKFYGKDPFALKNCLSGEALIHVQAVDDNYDEMMQRLDFKYGRPEKLVDVVINELKPLKKIDDNDNKRFIQMVDIIERSYLDLNKLNVQHEINTTSMLGQFERKMPPTRLHEWVLIKQTHLAGESQFEGFLKYIKLQRNAMEYTEEDLRQIPLKGRVNIVCDRIEGERDNPIQKQLDEILKGLAHVVDIVSRTGADGKGLREIPRKRERCFFHESDNHDIGDCTAFSALTVKNRFEMAKAKRSCFCCLQVGHMSINCANKQGCKIMIKIKIKIKIM